MTINVYYSADYNEYKMFLISLISLVENNKNNKINVFNLDVEVPEYKKSSKKLTNKQIKICTSVVKKYDKNNSFTNIDVSEIVRKKMLSKQAKSSYNFAAGVKTQWPIFIYNRCLLPYIPKIKFPKKLLWLDTDTIISKDLSDLFKIDISNYEWAGRKDINKISRFRPPMWITDKKFCNSCPIQNGVMLLNTEKCNIIFKKVIETYWKKDVGSGGSDMILFNLFSTKIYELDEKFNAYKYHPDNYIHHACGTRVCNGWIFGRMFLDHIHKKYTDGFFPLKNIFSKTLRVKPSEDLFYKIYPQYKKYLNIYNELND